MPVYNFLAYLQLICQATSFLIWDILKKDLHPSLLVLNNVGTWMHIGSISDKFHQFLGIVLADTLWEGKLSSHEHRDSDLVSRDVGVGRYHTSSTKVDSLAHHLHSEHTLLALKKLSHSLLLFLGCLLSHGCIHEDVHGILELDPLLGDGA
jgi:hypothetical protein